MGYGRCNSKAAYALMEKLYPLLGLQMNFFRPVRKLVAKQRLGAKVTKHYDEPRTPYQRLLAFGILDETAQQSLDKVLARLNPAELQRRIERLLHQLWDCIDHEKGASLANLG